MTFNLESEVNNSIKKETFKLGKRVGEKIESAISKLENGGWDDTFKEYISNAINRRWKTVVEIDWGEVVDIDKTKPEEFFKIWLESFGNDLSKAFAWTRTLPQLITFILKKVFGINKA